MSFYLLLCSSSELQTQLETLAASLDTPVSLLHTANWDEVVDCLQSLSDVRGVLVESSVFPLPENPPLPILLIGNEGHEGIPLLCPPLSPAALQESLKALESTPITSGDEANSTPQSNFTQALLKEVVHDLNNQFTTLQGHLPMLLERLPEEQDVLTDLLTASEKASRLSHLLECLQPDVLSSPEEFQFQELIAEFRPFAKKMYPKKLNIKFPEEDLSIQLQGDSVLNNMTLLRILWLYRLSGQPMLEFTTRVLPAFLELMITPCSELSVIDDFSTQLKNLAAQLPYGNLILSEKQGASLLRFSRISY